MTDSHSSQNEAAAPSDESSPPPPAPSPSPSAPSSSPAPSVSVSVSSLSSELLPSLTDLFAPSCSPPPPIPLAPLPAASCMLTPSSMLPAPAASSTLPAASATLSASAMQKAASAATIPLAAPSPDALESHARFTRCPCRGESVLSPRDAQRGGVVDLLGAGGAGGEDAAGMVRTLVTTLHDDVVRGAAAMHPTASASVRVEASSADLAVMKIATAGVWANGRPLSIIEPAPPAATLDERDTVPAQVQRFGVMLVFSSSTGIVSHCSDNARDLVGIDAPDWIGRDVREHIDAEVIDFLIAGARRAYERTVQLQEWRTRITKSFEADDMDALQRELGGNERLNSVLKQLKWGEVPIEEVHGLHARRFVSFGDKPFSAAMHVPDDCERMVLELIPSWPSRLSSQEWGRLLSRLIERLDSTSNIYRGAQMLLEVLNTALKVDRALVFRMMPPENDPEVVAEERGHADLYPFLGLRFPAMPDDERHRYVRASMRAIQDTSSSPSLLLSAADMHLMPNQQTAPPTMSATPVAVAPEQAEGQQEGPNTPEREGEQAECQAEKKLLPGFSLFHGYLCAPDISHLNVMRSLGIRGSMTLPICIGDALWGTVTFHKAKNALRQLLSWEEVQYLRAAVSVFAQWVCKQELQSRLRQEEQLRVMTDHLRRTFCNFVQREPHSTLARRVLSEPDMRAIAGADTFAIVCGSEWVRVGALPQQCWLDEFVCWVRDHAPDMRSSEHPIPDSLSEKVWWTTNLSRDYPRSTPDPRLAAGAIAFLMASTPLYLFVCFRVTSGKGSGSGELWENLQRNLSVGATDSSSSSGSAGSGSGAGHGAGGGAGSRNAAACSPCSTYAKQFLLAFQLSTPASCAPWPPNSINLIDVVSNSLISYLRESGRDPREFFHSNLLYLREQTRPQFSPSCRPLREELDGVLLLSRVSPRARPTWDEPCAMVQRGGAQPYRGRDRVLLVNQGWCDVFGFVETSDGQDRVLERCLAGAELPLEEVYHPLFNVSRTLNVWSRHRGHTTLAFRSFHDYSILLEDECFEVIGFTFRDVSVQTRVEQALLLAHQQSRRSEHSKQRLIGMVSHELRTPLTAILGFADVLASDPHLNDEQSEYVRDIQSAGSHLLNVITNLLDLTKLELSDAKKSEVDVVAITKEAVQWCQAAIESKKQTLRVRLPLRKKPSSSSASSASSPAAPSASASAAQQQGAELAEFVLVEGQPPCDPASPGLASGSSNIAPRMQAMWESRHLAAIYTLGDAVSIKRVIINLLDNSSKFTPEKGEISVSVRPLPLLHGATCGHIQISVEDNGVGMAPSVLAHIWEPFYQADSGDGKGSGLGLPMVKSLVELHGGSISVQSEAGRGTRFNVILHAMPAKVVPLSPLSVASSSTSSQFFLPRAILNPAVARLARAATSSSSTPTSSPECGLGQAGEEESPDTEWEQERRVKQKEREEEEVPWMASDMATLELGEPPPPVPQPEPAAAETQQQEASGSTLAVPTSAAPVASAAAGPAGISPTPSITKSVSPLSVSSAASASGGEGATIQRRASIAPSASPPQQHPGVRLMIVDDSQVNIKLFRRLLAMEGFPNVLTAIHGLACVEQLLLLRELERERDKRLQQGVVVPPTDDPDQLLQLLMPQHEASAFRARIISEAQSAASQVLTQLHLRQPHQSLISSNDMSDVQREGMHAKQRQEEKLSRSSSDEEKQPHQQQQPQPASAATSSSSPAVAAPSLVLSPPFSPPLLPSLLFLDLHMPLLDGFQTAITLRKLGFDLPIVALTASVGGSDRDMAQSLGFKRYLTKPIQRKPLREALGIGIEFHAARELELGAKPSPESPTRLIAAAQALEEEELHTPQPSPPLLASPDREQLASDTQPS